MYDEPPDPEPNPCPFCEEELGCGEGCAHCEMASKAADVEGKLATLRRQIGSRVRVLADLPIYADGQRENGVNPQFLMAAGLLMELGELKLPDDLMERARRSLLSEYGEWLSTEKDPSLIERWAALQWEAHTENLGRVLPADVLDRRGASPKDSLWILHLMDGRYVVTTEAEKRSRNDWSGGSGGPWGATLREFIDSALKSREESVGHWVEFALKYASPPADLSKRGAKISYVVGHEAYTAYVGYTQPSMYGGLGFGGSPFLVRLADGREFFSNNNWSVGTVPEHLRRQLRSNAVFAPGAEAEERKRAHAQPAAA